VFRATSQGHLTENSGDKCHGNYTFKGGSNYKMIKSLATSGIENSNDTYKKEFLELVKKAEQLKSTAKVEEEEE
jgi:Ca-activated chloride channel homolog